MVLDDGDVLIESGAILDGLDDLVGESRALLPRGGARRRDGLRVVSLATGLADKCVSLLYEEVLRPKALRSESWSERCRKQIRETLAALESDRSERETLWWLGDHLTHADIAVACALRFLREAHEEIYRALACPALEEHGARSEALPAFQAIYQPIVNNV